VFVLGRARLQVADIAHWEEHGEPAWESPPLAAGIRTRHPHVGDRNGRAGRKGDVDELARALQVARGEI